MRVLWLFGKNCRHVTSAANGDVELTFRRVCNQLARLRSIGDTLTVDGRDDVTRLKPRFLRDAIGCNLPDEDASRRLHERKPECVNQTGGRCVLGTRGRGG